MSCVKIEVFARENVCSGCLSVDRDLTMLHKKDLFVLLLSYGVSSKTQNIIQLCWECLAIVKKMESFQNRVMKAQKILETSLQREDDEFLQFLRTSQTKLHRIERSKIEKLWTSIENNLEYEITDCNLHDIKVKVKIERESDHEEGILEEPVLSLEGIKEDQIQEEPKLSVEAIEMDQIQEEPNLRLKGIKKDPIQDDQSKEVVFEVPILNTVEPAKVDVKNDKPKRKSKKGDSSEPSFIAKYKGKTKIIMLTREELDVEREQDRQSDRYLKLPYKCTNCIVAFDFQESLKDHLEKRHTQVEGGLVCEVCTSVLKTELSFREHRRGHYKRYQCIECDARSKALHTILRHSKETHGAPPILYKCKKCDFNTESNSQYRHHVYLKHTIHKCDVCSAVCNGREELRAHKHKLHGNAAVMYSCDLCDKSFRKLLSLRMHKRLEHGINADVRPDARRCGVCDKMFKTAATLASHVKSKHTAFAELKCEECDRVFKSKRSLDDHVLYMHVKKAEHKCQVCSKMFNRLTSLNKHIKYMHVDDSKERTKVCDYCGRGFRTANVLKIHIRMHTGERPLACQHCTARFANTSALYRHMRNVHKINKGNPRKKPVKSANEAEKLIKN